MNCVLLYQNNASGAMRRFFNVLKRPFYRLLSLKTKLSRLIFSFSLSAFAP